MSKGRERERVEGVPSRQGGKGMRRAASPACSAGLLGGSGELGAAAACRGWQSATSRLWSCVPGSWLDPGTRTAYL